jgi:O-6-methylguanine DNA methyltransferase
MSGSARGSHSEFRTRVIRVVRRIPVGRVATYGDVARVAGRPRAWRAVGTIMRTCGESSVPCHRVVAAGGRLGGYGGSEALKRALLQAEGIVVGNGRVRQFATVRWFSSPRRTGTHHASTFAAPKRARTSRKGGQPD